MDNRLSVLRAWPEILVVAIIVGLSLAGGGYSGVPVGAGTTLVWLLILAVSLSGRANLVRARRETVVAALCLMTLAGFTAFSLFWASDDGAGFTDVVRITGYAGAFILAGLLLILTPGRARSALIAIACGVFAVALIALGSRLGGLGGGDTELASVISATSGRLSYPIGYWNALGALMALGIPLFVWIAAEGPGPRPRAWALAGLCPPLLVACMTSSRGALLAALLGTVVVIGFATDRPRAAAAALVAVVASLPAICASSLMSGILDSPGTGTPGTSEVVVVLALIAGMALACVVGGELAMRLSRFRLKRFRLRPKLAIPVAVVVAVGLILLTGPARFIDDFRSVQNRSEVNAGILTVSGSGRAQFWGAALEAFADAPVKGIGAGGFGTYWNINGSLATPAKNVHSEPLELLAELGPVGLVAFISFFFVVARAGIRRARGPGAATAGAALGVVTAGSVGFLIDWTWQIPAVVIPVLIAAAVLTGSAFQAKPVPEGPRKLEGWRLGRWQDPAIAITLVVIAVAAVWMGVVLTLATSHLEASGRAFDRGEYGQAAQSARAAASVEPWSAEPWLQLATVEEGAHNFEAAQLDTAAAIDRAPQDFRSWLLAVQLESDQGNAVISRAYFLRARLLAPLVLARIAILGLSNSDGGI